jgi:hypothetical protein
MFYSNRSRIAQIPFCSVKSSRFFLELVSDTHFVEAFVKSTYLFLRPIDDALARMEGPSVPYLQLL